MLLCGVANLMLCYLVNRQNDCLAGSVQAGWYVALFCLCGAIGQLFIFGTIKKFGSLVNTLICTTRKFFNILLSVLWNGNPLLTQQWLAVFLVFAGLLTSSIAKSGKKKVVVEVTKEEKKAQ